MEQLVRALPLSLRAALLLLGLTLPVHAVSIDWMPVGDPGNAADSETGFGGVGSRYWISATEITNAQYVEYLNAVAASDPNELYNNGMTTNVHGGILRSGSDGSYSYTTKEGDARRPVNYITYYDALRFANWIQNGQPVGPQGNTTTEDGAYTITMEGIEDASITRNSGARVFLTNEDEWYKAAYYDPLSSSYFDYPTGTDTQVVCAAPGTTPNTANCSLNQIAEPTDVGSYTGSPSPNGTYDQAGNLLEWIETPPSGNAVKRGGSWNRHPRQAIASDRRFSSRVGSGNNTGFRIAMVPEPGTGVLLMTGLIALKLGRVPRALRMKPGGE